MADLAIVDVPQVANEPTPIKETVRRLTRIEKLAASGVLEPHMRLACEYYAECHAIGFDGACRTSNFEGGSGGGEAIDHLARSKREMMARDDYRWARGFLPSFLVGLFEAIIINQDTVSAIAAETFANNQRSQAEHKTRAALQLCANALYDGIKAVLPPLEDVPPSKPQRAAATAAPAVKETPAPRKPVTEEIYAKLDDVLLAGIPIAAIHLGHITLDALLAEAESSRKTGTTNSALDRETLTFAGIPIVARKTWPWGVILQPAEEEQTQAA